jgi:hypothetical protein
VSRKLPALPEKTGRCRAYRSMYRLKKKQTLKENTVYDKLGTRPGLKPGREGLKPGRMKGVLTRP